MSSYGDVFPSIGTPQGARGNSPLPGVAGPTVLTQPPTGPGPGAELSKINYDGLRDFGAATQNTFDQFVVKPAIDDQVKQSTEEGIASVAKDPVTGEITTGPARGNMFAWDRAFNDAQKTATLQLTHGDIRDQYQQIALSNPNDAAAFSGLAMTALKATAAKAPAAFRPEIILDGQQLLSQYSEGIYANGFKQTIDTSRQAIGAEMDDARGTLGALSHNQAADTPDFARAMQRFHAATDQLVANPAYGYSAGDQAKDIRDLQHSLNIQAAVGNAVRIGQSQGEAAGLRAAEEGLWSPDLQASIAERTTGLSQTMTQIHANAEAAKLGQENDARQLLGQLQDKESEALDTGKWEDTQFNTNTVISKLGPVNGPRAVALLNRNATINGVTKSIALAPPGRIAQLLDSTNPTLHPPAPMEPAVTLSEALLGQESGGSDNAPTSSTGVVGPMQIEPGTFAQYALPGESISKPQDNRAVGQRIVAAYQQKWPNDPARAAVAYFSGEGNVAPPDSLTPYIRDAKDPTGKSTSSYVSDVLHRIGATGPLAQGGFKDQETIHNAALQALDQRNKALVQDPVAWVLGNAPDLAQSIQSGDPATIQKGVQQLLQTERDIGLQQPRILDKPAAGAIVQSFDNPPDPTKAADFMNQTIDGLAAKYGSYFPQVMSELQKAGIPPEATALFDSRGEGAVANTLARAIGSMNRMGGKDLNANRDAYFANAPNNSEIRKNLPTEMGDYAASFRGNPDGPSKLASTTYTANLYAHELAYENPGMDAQAVARRAHDDLIGSRYQFDTGQDGYRMPVGVDAALVKAGANQIRNTLPASSPEPHGVGVAGVSTADRQGVSARILKSKGIWVTRSDDQGLNLVWPAESGYKPATTRDGRPISFSWVQLQQIGKTVPAPPASDPMILARRGY